MKKCLALILTVVMLSTCLFGCGSDTKESSSTAETKGTEGSSAPSNAGESTASSEENENWLGTADGQTITLRLWAGVQPEYGYDEMVENFNREYKDRGLQIEYVRYVNDTAGNLQLETYLMGGGEIDVFIGYGGLSKLRSRVESNLLLNMTDYLKAADFDLSQEFGTVNAESYYFDGDQIYGFPTKYENARWMLVNVDMFEEAGVEVPYEGWTYDEFQTALEKLTYGEGQDKVYGICWTFNQAPTIWKGLLGSVLGSYSTYKDDQCTEVNFADPIWKTGLEMVKSTVENGWAIPLEDEVTENMSVANTYLSEKCAISLNISQMRLVMDTAAYPHDFTTALVPGPVPGDEYMTDEYKYHSNTSGAGDIISIAANTAYPDQCFELVMWYVTGGMAPLAKGGRIPLWNGFDQESIVNMVLENAGDTIDEKSLYAYLSIDKTRTAKTYDLWASSEISTMWQEEVEAYLYDQQTVDQAIEHMVSRGNQLITDAMAAAGQ